MSSWKIESRLRSVMAFQKKLVSPWEIHVRLLQMQQGLIAIQAEVEISRRYIQHIRSVRAPVIYEIESILKKHKIEYQIWHAKMRQVHYKCH